MTLKLLCSDHHILQILEATTEVEFADELLDALLSDRFRPPEITYGDGIVTIRTEERTVSYGLGRHNALRNTTMGYLSNA